MNLAELSADTLPSLTDDQFRALLADTLNITQEDRKQNQILFYVPNNPRVQAFHDCKSKVAGIGGGNGSGKSEAMIVDTVMTMTGVFPYSQRHLVEQKFRGPINCRLVVESLTNTLEQVILPKLQWWKWSGVDMPGGKRGHWGWIPKECLIDGEWDKSYSTKYRVLRVLCRDPKNPEKVLGESTYQFMSKDMDPTDFASGDYHIIDHDEPPILPQWRENEARTMRVNGRLKLAMTWPDDPSIPVDWLFNEVYEPGLQGSDPNIKWFELSTRDNPNLDQEAVAIQAEKWSAEMRAVRIEGKPIRFSNRIHPDFTDSTKTWCFPCGKPVVRVEKRCGICGSEHVVEYNHVEEFSHSPTWPTIFLLDPHPRKPHMWLHVQVDPKDDWWVVDNGKLEGDCVEVRTEVHRREKEFGLRVAQRLMDPNMGASPSGQRREVSWQDEFSAAGLHCDLASDVDVGRSRINQLLKPDPDTQRPRITFHTRCKDAIYQMNRYVWAEFSRNVDRDIKQAPKDTNDDYPTLLKYMANSDPAFAFLRHGAPVINRGRRTGSYG